MNSIVRKILVALVLVGITAACAGPGPATEAPAPVENATKPVATEAPVVTEAPEEKVLRISYVEDILALDPTRNDMTGLQIFIRPNVYDGLLTYDQNGKFAPGLATSWTAVDDTTWELKLRKGVSFHNGEPFNAESVRFTFETSYLDPENPLYSLFFQQVDRVEVVDDYTVRIHTKVPYGPLLSSLTTTAMLPPRAYNAEAFTRTAIGTGPFKFVEWVPGERVVLVANDDYWGGRPAIDRVIWYPMPEATTRVAALRAGDVDIVFGIPGSDIDAIKSDPNLVILQVPGADTPVLSLGGRRAPYDNPLVRNAISMAIDMKSITETIMAGIAEPARSVISPTVFGFDPSAPEMKYDPVQAKELMAEAGYADGFKATMIVPIGAHPNNVECAQAISSMLSEIGVQVEVNASESGTIWSVLHSGEFEMFWNGWTSGTMDADENLWRNFHSISREGMNNPQVDSLLEAARSTVDQDKRQELYVELMPLLLDAPYRIPLFHLLDTWGVSAKVVGFSPQSSRMIYLAGVSLK